MIVVGNGNITDYSWGGIPWYAARFSITRVVIESGVTSIGDNAFTGCRSLATVNYSGTQAQWNAIKNNASMSNVNILFNDMRSRPANIQMKLPGSLTTVEAEAFAGNAAMTSVEIPGTVTAIQAGAFKDCSGLTTIVFDGNAPGIAEDAFAGVTASVYYPGDNASWSAVAFRNYGGKLTWLAYSAD